MPQGRSTKIAIARHKVRGQHRCLSIGASMSSVVVCGLLAKPRWIIAKRFVHSSQRQLKRKTPGAEEEKINGRTTLGKETVHTGTTIQRHVSSLPSPDQWTDLVLLRQLPSRGIEETREEGLSLKIRTDFFFKIEEKDGDSNSVSPSNTPVCATELLS